MNIDNDQKLLLKKTWINHLSNDILPYWLNKEMLGDPIGNFPTFADQNGIPIPGKPRYTRMHSRQIYVYLEAFRILGDKKLLKIANAGFDWLEKHMHSPYGGYYSCVSEDGRPLNIPISIQDQCYSVFPYITLYKIAKEPCVLDRVEEVIKLIWEGPYSEQNVIKYDAFDNSLKYNRDFEGPQPNIVSLLDFLNILLVPYLKMGKMNDRTFLNKTMNDVEQLIKLYDEKTGIFFNNLENKSDYTAKHVDLGHTSKAYGIIFDIDRILEENGLPAKYLEIEKRYYSLIEKATQETFGWYTDFQEDGNGVKPDSLQWWRHIMIDQITAKYSMKYPEFKPLLLNGLNAWFNLPFVDNTREVRGIREGLRLDGTLWGNDDSMTCKANLWKNGYHEVEHISSMLEFINMEND